MLFRRRKPDSFWERIRTWIWPRRSFQRSLQYMSKRVLRLSGSPHAIAAGVAAGVFASCTPFLGFHIIMAAIIAYLLGGNIVASAVGTTFCNPLTFPFIIGSTLGIGRFILHGRFHEIGHPMKVGHMLGHLHFSQLWEPLIKPMAIGAVPVGIAMALLFYGLTFYAAIGFREQRRRRLAEKARRRAAAGSVPAGYAAE